MTKEQLQKELDKNNINAKVLGIRKNDYGDYEIIFTFDLQYSVSENEVINRDSIIEPEEDVLAEDLSDALAEIKYRLANQEYIEHFNSK